jgi:hypothetical protein
VFSTRSFIINDCPIAVGVENPHKFWMCRQPRNVRQINRHYISYIGCVKKDFQLKKKLSESENKNGQQLKIPYIIIMVTFFFLSRWSKRLIVPSWILHPARRLSQSPWPRSAEDPTGLLRENSFRLRPSPSSSCYKNRTRPETKQDKEDTKSCPPR